MENMEICEEENDPVIQTIPIFVNRMQDPPACTGEMSLLQFPLRPSDRPYGDEGQLVNVQLAPGESRATRLRLSYELKQSPDFYDSHATFPVAERHLVSRLLPDTAIGGLAVGVIDEGELTLIPLASVNQLRPEFNYVNSDPVGLPPSASAGATLTSKQQHLYSIAQQLLQTRGDNLDWKDADFYEEDAQETEDLFLEHIVVSSNHVRSAFAHKRTPLDLKEEWLNYISSLAGVESKESGVGPAGSAAPTVGLSRPGVDLIDLARMDVDKQIEALLKAAQVLSHDQLLESLHPNVRLHCSEERLLTAISQSAFLVKGFWVAKSQFTNVKASQWSPRDIVLLACSKGADLNEHFIGKYLGSASDADIDEILRPLCAPDSARKIWKWRHGVDVTFAERFPAETANQAKRLDDHIRTAMNLAQSSQNQAAQPQQSQLVNHADKTVKDLLSLQAASFEDVKKALQSVNKDKEVSDQAVTDSLARLGVLEIRPKWFCLPAGALLDPVMDGYRDILIQIYRVQDRVNKMQILEQIKALNGRDCELTDHDLRKLIKEFAKLERGYWVFRGAVKQES